MRIRAVEIQQAGILYLGIRCWDEGSTANFCHFFQATMRSPGFQVESKYLWLYQF
jgi:hypothetical protein